MTDYDLPDDFETDVHLSAKHQVYFCMTQPKENIDGTAKCTFYISDVSNCANILCDVAENSKIVRELVNKIVLTQLSKNRNN